MPPVSTVKVAKENLKRLSLEGPGNALDACVGLLGTWIKGAREYPGSGSADDSSRLDLYIATTEQAGVEAAWLDWQEQGLPAVTGVKKSWTDVEEEDWALNWRETFAPLRVTGKITIVPDWDRVTEAPILIRVRPGRAFGTGHHTTTQQLLRNLERQGCRGRRVLDLGTGSGVLAIAAALLGARYVLAVEQDPSCAENFTTNLELNGLSGKIDLVERDASIWDDFDYDLVTANINRQIIFPLMTRFARSDSPAKLLVSGLLAEEESQLRQHCDQQGLKLSELEREGEWISAVVVL